MGNEQRREADAIPQSDQLLEDLALRDDVEQLSSTPFLSPVRVVGGLIYDVESGQVDDVVRWERP